MILPRFNRLAACTALGMLLLGGGAAEAAFFTTTPSASGTLDFGYVLVGTSATGNVTATNTSSSKIQVTFGATTGAFAPSNAQTVTNLSNAKGKNTATRGYTYAPTARGLSQQGITVTGGPTGTKAPTTSSITLKGTGVAPVNQVVTTGAGLTRIGTTGTGQITITNVGDGNLSHRGAVSNLNGSVQSLALPNFAVTGPSFSLADNGGPLVVPYLYTPAGHGSDATTASINFSNGSSDGKNQAQVVSAQLSGQGVGPTFHSSAAPGSTLDFGQVLRGKTGSLPLTVSNVSTDPNGGNSHLTDLTVEKATFSGPDAALFSLKGFTPGAVISESGALPFTVRFNSQGKVGAKSATLTLVTDEGAAFGAIGSVYDFGVTGAVVAPEPGTMVLAVAGAVGLLGHGWLRRRRGREAGAGL